MNRRALLLFATLLLTSTSAWATTPRFVDLKEGSILDTKTRFRWLKNANCFPGVDGKDYAPILLVSGQCGLTDGVTDDSYWRTPSLEILRTLVLDGYRADSLNAAGFVGFQAGGYWATDTIPGTYWQWTVSFADGQEYPIVWSSTSMNLEPYGLRFFNYLDVSPSAADFSAVAVNTTSDSRTFSLQNLGGGDDDFLNESDLNVTEIAIVGADSDQFTLDTGNGDNYHYLAVGACGPQPEVHHADRPTVPSSSVFCSRPMPCTINVAFAPTSPGRKTATLRITATNVKNPVVEIPLTGNTLVSWWKADGNAVDSVGPNDGTFASAVTASAAEGGTATASCPAGMTIVSFTSQYGAGTGWTSCGSCSLGAADCSVTFSNAVCGDPAAGFVKSGKLDLACSAGGNQSTNFLPGKVGQAFSFDGSGPLAVTVPDSSTLDLYGEHTVAFWIKLNALPPAGKNFFPVSKFRVAAEDKRVSIDSAGKVGYYLHGTTGAVTQSNTVLVPGTWYHVAATYDGAAQRVFINGVLDAAGPSMGDVADSIGTLYLGYSPDWAAGGSAAYFDGLLDEVKWYTRALTQEEIALSKAVERLTVTTAGAAAGSVTASPVGLTWTGNTGSAELNAGTSVSLTATFDPASTLFTGWSGACSGNAGCSFTINADTAVTATFEPIVGVNGIVYPVTGAQPQAVDTLVPISDRYEVSSITWTPADPQFAAGTVYTATIVLSSPTSANGYAFPAGLTPRVNVGTASPGSIVTSTSGTTVTTTLTFNVTFAATCLPSFTDATGTGCVACDAISACGTDCTPCATSGADSTSCSGNTASSEVACVPTCSSGHLNRDGNGANGCEACQDPSFCGSDCGVCSSSGVSLAFCMTNGEPAQTACSPMCADGFLDFDQNAQNGCEACTVAAACGSDCRACSSDGTSATSCSGNTDPSQSACVPTCAAGYQDVDGSGQNGCEPCSAVERCGSECDACSADGTSATACSGNTASSDLACVPTCAQGFDDANGDGRDGCEACAAGYYEKASSPLTCEACNTHSRCGPGCVDCTALPVDECHAPPACDVAAGQCVLEQAPDGTECTGGTCQDGVCTATVDAGVPEQDAGSSTDAGATETDAGTSVVDAGAAEDAGAARDAGAPAADAGIAGADATPDASGCGCSSGAGPVHGAPLLLALAFLRRRGRNR